MSKQGLSEPFHNISLELENISKEVLKDFFDFSVCDRPIETIFDADSIDSTYFFEVMVILLNIKSNFKILQEKEEFLIKYKNYYKERSKNIEIIEARNMLEEFKKILNKV